MIQPLKQKIRVTFGISLIIGIFLFSATGGNASSFPAPIAQPSIPSRTAADNLLDEGVQLLEQGTAEGRRGAIAKYQEALAFFKERGELEKVAEIANAIGFQYHILGDDRQAISAYNEALSLYRELGNIALEAYTLTNIGDVYSTLWQNEKALSFYTRALPLREKAGLPLGIAATLNNLAGVYSNLEENQKALDAYNRAIAIYRENFSPRDEAATLSNLGNLYWNLGDFQQALDYYEKALLLDRLTDNAAGIAQSLFSIGGTYLRQGNPQPALVFFNEALTLQQDLEDGTAKALTLTYIGEAKAMLGETQNALEFYDRALPLYRPQSDRALLAYTLNQIGRAHLDLGQPERALSDHARALKLNRELGNRTDEASTLYYIALAERDRNQLEAALERIQSATEIIESLRATIVNPRLRASYLANRQELYELYIDLLMQLHQQRPDRGYNASALQISELARARVLLELLVEANADIRQGVDPDLLAQERSVRQNLDAIEQRRVRLYSHSYARERATQLERERETLLSQYRKIQTQIRTASPQYAALTQPQPLSLSEIQQQILDEDTLLLQYSLGEERSYLWLVGKNNLSSYELPPRAQIEAAARQFYQRLQQPRYNYQRRNVSARSRPSIASRSQPAATPEPASQLSQLLLGSVADRLHNKRLVIVSDGALQYIPFAALPLPGIEQAETPTLAIARHEIVQLPSTSTLGILRQNRGQRQPAPRQLALLADPVFDPDDPRVTATAPHIANGETLNQQLLNRSSRESDVGLTRLPGTRREADAIAALIPELQRTQVFGFAADRDFATDERLSQYRILHLATHGILNSVNPELSGVVLSLVDKRGNPQNGFLRLHDVFNLNLNAELVVLSACQTALGKEIEGEGLVGLTRGFMYAGAPRVVVSLWNVDDEATAELMARFYRALLRDGLPAAAALRQAQVEMRTETKWKNPYYWAAFVLQGEWQKGDE